MELVVAFEVLGLVVVLKSLLTALVTVVGIVVVTGVLVLEEVVAISAVLV